MLFEPVGSPPAGVIRLFGTQTQIDDFIRSEDFRSSIQKAGGALHAVGLALHDRRGAARSLGTGRRSARGNLRVLAAATSAPRHDGTRLRS